MKLVTQSVSHECDISKTFYETHKFDGIVTQFGFKIFMAKRLVLNSGQTQRKKKKNVQFFTVIGQKTRVKKFETYFFVFFSREVFHRNRSWRKMRNNHQSLEPKDDECATEITNNLPKLQKENKCEEDDGYLR